MITLPPHRYNVDISLKTLYYPFLFLVELPLYYLTGLGTLKYA